MPSQWPILVRRGLLIDWILLRTLINLNSIMSKALGIGVAILQAPEKQLPRLRPRHRNTLSAAGIRGIAVCTAHLIRCRWSVCEVRTFSPPFSFLLYGFRSVCWSLSRHESNCLVLPERHFTFLLSSVCCVATSYHGHQPLGRLAHTAGPASSTFGGQLTRCQSTRVSSIAAVSWHTSRPTNTECLRCVSRKYAAQTAQGRGVFCSSGT